jgi:hypothetical protein
MALPISRLISVQVNLSPQAAQAQNLSTLLILGSSPIIDTKTRMRSYDTIDQVATDFGTSASEYLAAVLWFEQSPRPGKLLIGRWAQNATSGQLFGAPLSLTNAQLAVWQAIVNGGFTITIDGAAPVTLAGLNFAAVSNFNGIAAIIDAALAGATVVYNSVYSRFEITSATTGVASIVSFATPSGAGTDISHMLGIGPVDGGYQANGMAAETALSAVTYFDQNFGQQWFGLVVLGAVNADHLAIAPYIEATEAYHVYGITSQEAAAVVPTATTDIGYQIKQLGLDYTTYQYSGLNPYAVVSMLARILPVNYSGNNTVISLMYKKEPGIGAETLTPTQADALAAKNYNVFVQFDNDTAIIVDGKVSSGQWLDTVIGAAAFAVAIQNGVYNVLYTSTTKIPQTDQGNHVLTTAIEQIGSQFETNGFLGAGIWDEDGFGTLQRGDPMPKGYYVFAPPIATQAAADRSARISVPIQVAAKLAGAVHKANVIVTVNS